MSRAEALWGTNDPDRMFPGDAPQTMAPWPRAVGRKAQFDYEKDKVTASLSQDPVLQEVDPRTLTSTQPSVTSSGVRHYMGSDEVMSDKHQAGNKNPVVYKRDDGKNLILSGHHRASAALLKGQPLKAVVVEGGWGGPR